MRPAFPARFADCSKGECFMASATPSRFIGLDIHKHYLVATGVNEQMEQVFGPYTVQLSRLEAWADKHLTNQDALVMEMSTNSFELHDELVDKVHSVTLVHPPHVALIVRAQVKTDKKAALNLAQLHAAGLLPPVWVPPVEIRELRALMAHRRKMVRLGTQAKNRMHSTLHRLKILPPEGDIFTDDKEEWWLELPLSLLEKAQIESNWATWMFAQEQIKQMETIMADYSAQDERIPYLIQLPGFGLVVALTVLAAIGDIRRFPTARHLVGYAGLGARVHDSGLTHKTGRITKAGRRDLRGAMVQAARIAARYNPKWESELKRLEVRMGYQKAIVAISRKLLVVVWHVMTKQIADRHAEPEQVARKLLFHAYALGKERRPEGQTSMEYVREHLDQLNMDVKSFKLSGKQVKLPSS
jgi:transposase